MDPEEARRVRLRYVQALFHVFPNAVAEVSEHFAYIYQLRPELEASFNPNGLVDLTQKDIVRFFRGPLSSFHTDTNKHIAKEICHQASQAVGYIKDLYERKLNNSEIEPGLWEIRTHKPYINVGSGPQADITIAGGYGIDFRIFQEEGKKEKEWKIMLTSPGMVIVGLFSLKVGESRRLKSGDTFRADRHEFVFEIRDEKAYLRQTSPLEILQAERVIPKEPRITRDNKLFMHAGQRLILRGVSNWDQVVRLARDRGEYRGTSSLNVAEASRFRVTEKQYGVIERNGGGFVLTVKNKSVSVQSPEGEAKPANDGKITLEKGDTIIVGEQKIVFHP